MDRLLVFQYLKDGAGNYILDGDGNFIVNATAEYPVDLSTAGIASHRGDLRAVNSFAVIANDAGDDWTLIINQYNLVGRFPSQATALGALAGCFIHAGATQDGLEFMISEMVQDGTGQIDEDGDNLMSQKIQNGEFIGTLRNFNKDLWAGTTNSMQQDLLVVGNVTEQLLLNDPLQTIVVPARYDTSYSFEVRTDKPLPNAIALPAEVIPALSVNLSFPVGTPIVDQPLTATATLTNEDARIPVKYQWTWKENPSGANTTVKTETTTSSTSSYTPTDTSNYRVEVEILYALDDSSTGVTDSETSSNAFQPFEWLQGPEIVYQAQDQYQVISTGGVDYEGTIPVTFNYEWMKNGSPFGTDSASQLLTDAGNYTVDVTGSNTVNSQTFTDSIVSRNSITITPSVHVDEIRLFTGQTGSGDNAMPVGSPVADPVDGQTYYAFAYSNGVLISGKPVEWYEGQGVLATFTGTPAPSHVDPTDGDELSVTNIGMAGNPAATISYLWSDGSTSPSLDTTGMEGDVITCTVTASNIWDPVDEATVNFGTVQVPVVANDWDTEPTTYFHSTAGTVGYIFNIAGWNSTGTSGGDVPPETTTTSGGNARMVNTVSGGWDGSIVNSLYPYVYVWTAADGWSKVTQTSTAQFRSALDFDSVTVNYAGNPDFAFAFYTTDQGDISGWRAYDGPTATPTAPVSTQQWTVTLATTVTEVSVNQTGLEITDATRTLNCADIGSGWPRCFCGPESANYGATNLFFPTTQDCKDYYETWEGRFRQDGGDWIEFSQATFWEAQTSYALLAFYGGSTPSILVPTVGMVYDIEWYNIGDMPT